MTSGRNHSGRSRETAARIALDSAVCDGVRACEAAAVYARAGRLIPANHQMDPRPSSCAIISPGRAAHLDALARTSVRASTEVADEGCVVV